MVKLIKRVKNGAFVPTAKQRSFPGHRAFQEHCVVTQRAWRLKSCVTFEPSRCFVSVKSKLQHAPPGHTPGIWHLCRPGEGGIWLSESSRGWGIWSPCFRVGGCELHPRFHVKSLAWRANMGGAVLDCAFVASWLRGKGLNKLCAVFEVFKFWNFSGFECMNVFYCCVFFRCFAWDFCS